MLRALFFESLRLYAQKHRASLHVRPILRDPIFFSLRLRNFSSRTCTNPYAYVRDTSH